MLYYITYIYIYIHLYIYNDVSYHYDHYEHVPQSLYSQGLLIHPLWVNDSHKGGKLDIRFLYFYHFVPGVFGATPPRILGILGSPRCFQTVCPHWSFCKIRSQSWWNQYCWLRMAGDLSVEWCKSLGLSVGFVLDMSQHVSTLFQSEFTETWPLMHFNCIS